MNRIGIVAAFPGELKPLVQNWRRHDHTFRGHIGSIQVAAACSGMGAAAVARAVEHVLAPGGVDTLVSVGWAGSLSCGLRPPEAVQVREVIDDATGERFPTASEEGQRLGQVLVTLDHVAGQEEKRTLAEKYQATLVDMEAAAVARIARDRGLAFLCFKAVTDGPNDKLPDFNRFIGEQGQVHVPSLARWAALRPAHWGPLRRLGKNSRLAAQELANFLSRSLAGSVH
ncbi:MAG: phosphorylase [Acidobacteriaceae bacterium]